MKPLISVIFINNDLEYKKSLLDQDQRVEKIGLSSNGFIKEIYLMNYGIRMASGEYVCCILEGDVLPNNFFDEVMLGVGSRRDVVLFSSTNSNGLTKKYTSIPTRRNFSEDNLVLGVQYFHPVKRRLIKHVMFVEERDRDYLEFYSKQIGNVVFSEYQLRNLAIKSDSV